MDPPLKPERALLLQAFHVPMYPSGPDCSRLDLDGPPLKPKRALLVQLGPDCSRMDPSGPSIAQVGLVTPGVSYASTGSQCF